MNTIPREVKIKGRRLRPETVAYMQKVAGAVSIIFNDDEDDSSGMTMITVPGQHRIRYSVPHEKYQGERWDVEVVIRKPSMETRRVGAVIVVSLTFSSSEDKESSWSGGFYSNSGWITVNLYLDGSSGRLRPLRVKEAKDFIKTAEEIAGVWVERIEASDVGIMMVTLRVD